MLKRFLYAITTLVSLLSLSGTLLAATPPTIDDLNIISLDSDRRAEARSYPYPGMGQGSDGTNRWDAPDCLMLLVDRMVWDLPDGALERLANSIVVQDGPGVLFRDLETNVLSADLRFRRYLVYPLQDLGKFITGIRVRARGHRSLREALKASFGDDFNGSVALQVVRGCRTLPN